MRQFKSVTATKFVLNRIPVYDHVCAHNPVVITNNDRPDITLVLRTDYEDLLNEVEELRNKLN